MNENPFGITNTMNQTHYKIISLRVSNVKRIKAIEILPSGDVITIGGKNDAGKSSLIDSIFYLLAGSGVVCEQPIRQGANKAEITAELKEYPGTDEKAILIGDLIVKKQFSINGAPTLRITTKEGVPLSSPQTILDQLCVKVTFDPLAFTRLEPIKQVDTLRKLVGLDFTELNAKQKRIYEDRALTNREVAVRRGKLQHMVHHEDAPEVEVSVADLMGKLNEIRQKNAANAAVRNKTAAVNSKVLDAQREIDHTQLEIKELTAKLNSVNQRLVEEQKIHKTMLDDQKAHETQLATLVDLDELGVQTEITNADKVNVKVRENNTRLALSAEMATLETKSANQTIAHDAINVEREYLLKQCKFPLDGLGFDDSGVLLHGVPFDQAGTAAKIKASMAIGLALNPKLRIILIRDGALLDDESMKVVAEMAKANDAQCWIELVGEGGHPSVVIEDGQIKEV